MENSNFNVLVETLRETLPIHKHPTKASYSWSQILALYTVDTSDFTECWSYGDSHCICGHAVKYEYTATYIYDANIEVGPIGSECIKKFSEVCSYMILKPIIDHIQLGQLWNNCYTMKDFSAKSGFTTEAMRYLLKSGCLSYYQQAFLADIVAKRRAIGLTPKQIKFMYGIMKTIKGFYEAENKKALADL